jgi:AbrB family looped-hinge helix DNA binding protein
MALTKYGSQFIPENMKIGERGQVTIPKDIREQFGLVPETEVEFRVVGGSIILKKAPKKVNVEKWKGRCGNAFAKQGYSSVDAFIEDIRGR